MPKTYTVKDVATILGFSTNSIYAFLKAKRIKGVRVGKGRFRIPEEELSRILHLSKKPVDSFVRPVDMQTQREQIASFVDSNMGVKPIRPNTVLEANFFDWFIGISSVITGVALMLFNSSTQTEPMSRLFPMIRAVLVVAGLGIIVSSVLNTSRRWHVFFHIILGITGMMGAYGLARGSDACGAVLYGSLSLVTFVNTIKRFTMETLMGSLMTMVAFGTVIVMALWSEHAYMKSFVSLIGLPIQTILWIFLGIEIGTASLYWVGYIRRFRWMFVTGCVIASIACMLTAGFYGEILYWSRAFFYVVLSFFCLLLPVLQLLEPKKTLRQRLYLHLFFGGIGGLLLLSIIVVFSLHQVLWLQRVNDFDNKIRGGKTILENAISSVQSSVVTASGNADFIKAAEKEDSEALVKNAKIIYEGNPLIRRLVFLNKRGDGIAIYPYGVFDRANYAFRDYFTRTRDTKSIYISNVIETNIDQIHRPVVSVTMPFFDTKEVFHGVMTASINLEKIALQLQQVALESGGEFFTVVDDTGKYIIHPNSAMIGTVVSPSNPLSKGIEKKRGIENTVLPDERLGLIAYDAISNLGWAISVQAPTVSVLALSTFSLVLTFGTIFSIFVIAILFLYLMKFRWLPQQRGSP